MCNKFCGGFVVFFDFSGVISSSLPDFVFWILEANADFLASVMALECLFSVLGSFMLSFLSFFRMSVYVDFDEDLLDEFEGSRLIVALEICAEAFDFKCVLSSALVILFFFLSVY
jgi:hypothetical protein